MDNYSKISVEEISKRDMLMIIKALEYTGQETGISSFIELKNTIVQQLSQLYNTSEKSIVDFLEKNL